MLSANRHPLSKVKGFTVVELMIGLVLGALIIGSIISLYGSMVKRSHEALQISGLNQELHNALSIITSHLRRAGYWGQAHTLGTNPFTQNDTDITINGSQDCILFSYDLNGDGAIATLNSGNDERYGFRLNNNRLQARPSSAAYDCTAATNSWEDLTDANRVQITSLIFTPNNTTIDLDGADPGTATIQLREVTISITGQLNDDNTIASTLSQTLKVRNDVYAN